MTGAGGGPAAITEPSRSTPVHGEFDVVVVGGGPAGIMAATAAARTGYSTILLERYGFLGGAGTAGGLSTFCGLHAKVHGEHRQVIHGLADELLDRLAKLDGLSRPHLTINDGIQAQAFDISSYKIAADELVVGSGAGLLFHAMAVGLVMGAGDHIDAVLIESKSGRAAVRGRVFIDATGDGDVAAWAGVPYEKSPALGGMMYPSLMFRINGVDAAAAGEAPWRTVERLMDAAERAGTHTFPRKKPIVRPQRNPLEWRANLTQLSNPDGSAVDGTDVAELTEDDVLGCADFPDTIGVNGWPVEAHVAGTVEFRWPRGENPRGFNQLPFRMMLPPGLRNLYVIGRCASMTHGAQSAARVTGPCFAMGEAAGTAAGMALRAGTDTAPASTWPPCSNGWNGAAPTWGGSLVGELRSNFEPGTTRWAMRLAQWTALGLTPDDMEKPKIAIVNSSSDLASCFSHLDGIVRGEAERRAADRRVRGGRRRARADAPAAADAGHQPAHRGRDHPRKGSPPSGPARCGPARCSC